MRDPVDDPRCLGCPVAGAFRDQRDQLLIEIAMLRGTSEAVQRNNHPQVEPDEPPRRR